MNDVNQFMIPLFLGASYLIGTGICFVAVIGIIRGRANRTWSPVQATILSSEIRKSSSSGGNFGHGSTITYEPLVTYSYSVQGRTYKGETIAALTSSFSKGEGDSMRKGLKPLPYRVGETVPAYVDPLNPERSVLVRGINPAVWIILIATCLFLGGITWFFLSGF